MNQIPSLPNELHRRATRKAFLKLIPLMCAIYFMSFLDRTNVALAKVHLAADVGISAAAYGLGAGIFFLGYALLEVPSNLLAHRIGPRRWIARIAVSWGILSVGMMFVAGERSFYIMRVLLGIAEAGLFPALMYMVTLWFGTADRPVAIGWIYTAPALALLLGNPIGGALLQLDGHGDLHGWQWMFLVEGIPSILLGIVLYFKMPDRPSEAAWLNKDESAALENQALADVPQHAKYFSSDWVAAIKRPTTILIGLIYFLNQVAFVGLYFFAPAMISQMKIDSPLVVGLLSASVGLGFLLGVLVLPRIHRRVASDARYLGALGFGLVLGAAAFILTASLVGKVLLLAVTAFFAGGVLPSYWSIAMKRLSGIQAAAGLAFINTVGLLGGFAGPYLFGMAESATGRSESGFLVILVAAILGLLLVPLLAIAFAKESGVAVGLEARA